MEEYTVWIDVKNKIVSFHKTPDFEEMVFLLRDSFLSYVQSLSDAGYRFQ